MAHQLGDKDCGELKNAIHERTPELTLKENLIFSSIRKDTNHWATEYWRER